MLKVISLDLWKTLIYPNVLFRKHRINTVAQALGCEATAAFQQRIRDIDDYLDKKTDFSGQQFGCVARIEFLANELGYVKQIDYEKLYAEINDAFLAYPPSLIEASLAETLQQLQELNIRIALLSNTGFIEGNAIRKLFNHLKISNLFDLLLFSDEHNIAKPNTEFFLKIPTYFNCEPQAILHIGDNPVADYDGALRANMKAFLFDNSQIQQEPRIEKLAYLPQIICS